METLLLTRKDLAALLTMDTCLPAVEEAFASFGRGEALMPAKVYLPLEKEGGDFRAMPSYLDGAAGLKWVNSHPHNPERHGLPAVLALYILSDPETAAPLAVMDGTLLTAIRTGAAAGIASRHLAHPGAKSLGFIGCGVQARYFLEAHRVALGEAFEGLELRMADRIPTAARLFAKEAGGEAVSVEVAAGCDIVCTATPSCEPVVRRAWVGADAHYNAMGADGPGKQELDPEILFDARVFIDDAHQAFASGEVNVPHAAGDFPEERVAGTLGEVVAGLAPGREGGGITVFDSTGLAVQDLAVARLAYAAAREAGVGLSLDLVG
ncbi:MAG: ornithine cyclodeaminase family protein [Deltaproteobacteria bacterium]|nr:ornithine cyclodeaminase family protein [Deltaproteobacteria bacterium]